jgi:DNA-binding CsgD family transcriptional regulator
VTATREQPRGTANSTTPLLERHAEVAALAAMVEAAHGGDGRLVAIEGPAGIGKTRLVAEARTLATGAGFDVLTARGGELERDFAFGVVRQLFETRLATSSPEDRADLLSGAAALAAPLFEQATPAAIAEVGGDASFAMLHGLYWLAANVALHQPLLLAVDDLHWADEPSLRWLSYLARRLEGLPLLVVAATRPPEQARTPSLVTEILADPLAAVIRPGALGQESAATLAQALFGLEPDAAFAAALRETSGGNPLYLAALLDAVARQQIPPTAEQAPRLLEVGGEALSRGIGLRLARLPDRSAALLRAAAILGDQTELPLAAALADLDASTALTAASELVRSDLLQQENPLAFSHPVVRTAVLEDMNAGERMRAYRRAAEVLLESGALPEQAATYLVPTIPDHDGFVVATLRQAAQRSRAQGAPEAAVAYLRRALNEPPESQERREVLGELGIAESAVFEADAGAAHLRQALDELDDITKRPDLVLAYVNALELLANRAPEEIELLTQLSKGSQHDRVFSERIDAQLMRAALYDGELYRIAREHWDAISARDARESIQAGALLATGAIEEARRGISRERAVELARRAAASGIGRTPERIYLGNALYALMLAGEVEEAESGLQAGIEDARRAGDRFSGAIYHMWRGLLSMERGKLLTAEEDLGVPEVISFEALATALVYRAAFLAEVLVPRGEYAGAEALLARVDIEEVQAGHRILFLCGRGRLYLETGRAEQALADFRAIGEIAQSIGIENPAFCPWRSQAALALRQLGRADEARDLAREELELSRRWGAPRTIGVSLRALGLVEGGQTGEELLREAVDALAESPARLEHARALIDLGAALRRANSRSEARKQLRAGLELAQQCGATALFEQANDELAATGAHRRTILLSGLDALTASERRVAQMAADGSSNKEIAQALFVTVKTVEMHLGRVYRKLELSSRAQLAGALNRPAAQVPATA